LGQVLAEMQKHSQGNEDARDVGQQPAWVADDLKDRTALAVLEKTGLVKGLAGVP
jgi:hypothetical protein